MRIRSIKPDFWRSQDITSIKDWDVRLVFIGLWSYVDDNGVGKDRVAVIAADLFADDLEDNPRETFARVSGALATLSAVGRIVRYTVDGKDFLEVVNWLKHQKIDHPNKPRYPHSTCEDAAIREGLANLSRDPIEDVGPGAGEQGSRGAGEKEPPYPPGDEPEPPQPPARQTGSNKALARFDAIPGRSIDAYRIAEAFSASLPVPIEEELLSGIGVQIDKCLKRGIPPPAIATGLKAWTDSDSWSPTQIPNFVHKSNNGSRPNGVGKPTEKAIGYDSALQELLQEVTTL